MGIIDNLTKFVAGTKALSSEVNQNFEALKQGHNNQENRITTLETGIANKFDKSGGNLTGSLFFADAVNIDVSADTLTLSNNSNSFIVSGVTTITKIAGWNKGVAIIRWNSSRLLQCGANLLLQGGVNRMTIQGDIGIYEIQGNTAREINYFPYNSNKSNNFKAQTVLNSPKNALGYADFIKKIEFNPDVIPLMAANTNADCTITSSSQYDANYMPWKACDNYNGDAFCWLTQNGINTGWFKLNFTNPKKAVALALTSRNSTDANTTSPRDFIIEGSNDDINYTLLGGYTGITGWLQNEKRLFAFLNTTIYKYYRVTITANNGLAAYTGIGEFELFEAQNDIPALGTKIDCSQDIPILINYGRGYNFNGKVNETAALIIPQTIYDLFDNSLSYIGSEKNPDGSVTTFKTTACPAYVMAKQKHSTFNSIPQMYSFVNSYEFTLGYAASSSSMAGPPTGQPADFYGAWKAFDKAPGSKWMASVVGGNQYLEIDFPNKRKSARFGLRASDVPTQMIKNGYIKGWDGTSWRILATIINQTAWVAYETRYFDVSLFADCSKFKLEITDINNMADLASVCEFEIYELAHCYVIPENKVYFFNTDTNIFEERQITYLGKAYASNGLVTDVRTFAQNGKYRSQEIDLAINSIYNFYHNIGADNKNIRITGWIKDKINGYILPWFVTSNIDYSFDVNNYGYALDDCRFVVRTGTVLMNYRELWGTNRGITSNVSLILEIERNFE